MNEQKKSNLKERLASLDSNERLKLYKRAAVMRKAGQRTDKRQDRFSDWDDEATVVRKKKADSLDDWVLKILEQEEPPVDRSFGDRVKGVVVWIGPKACRVRLPGAEINCEIAKEIAREQQTLLAVGDEVIVLRTEERETVLEVLPRRTKLSRPDPSGNHVERVLVANVDIVVITVSVKGPPLHPRLIDRYLVAVQRGGAQAAICVNKLDLLTDAHERREELSKLDPYARIGVEITTCSTTTFEGMAKLRQVIEGKTCAFVGHSGVGKSSILNALHPELQLKTNAVWESYGRGRHTTTASSMYDLGAGTRLIDTPGIRSFGLWEMSAAELAWYFPEFEIPAQRCKFRDCTHVHEPHCGVRDAIRSGAVSQYRYDTFRRMLAES